MTKEQIVEMLLTIRENAVYDEIVKGNNDDKTIEFHFALGKEEAVCEVLNALCDANVVTLEQLQFSFERGRDRGWKIRNAS